jgi:hypothetical protein
MAKIDLDQEDDWAEDMSPAAIKARQDDLASAAVKKMTGSEDDPYADFGAYVEAHRKNWPFNLNSGCVTSRDQE